MLLINDGKSDVEKKPLKLSVKPQTTKCNFVKWNKNKWFLSIFTANKQFTALFVIREKETLDFASVKHKNFQWHIMTNRKKYLKEYFEKEKLTADIK